MSAYSRLDHETFNWLKSEIQVTLDASRSDLSGYNRSKDTSALYSLNNHLHQIVGCLQVLELDSLSRLLIEDELLIEDVIHEKNDIKEATFTLLLESSFSILQSSLQKIAENSSEDLIQVVELINQIRSERGTDAVEISSLFSPMIDVFPEVQALNVLSDSNYRKRAGILRSHYQNFLLNWLRDGDVGALDSLRVVVDKLFYMSSFGSVARLWWVVAGYIDYLKINELQNRAVHSRIFRGIDDLLRKLHQHAESALVRDPGEELIKMMLFYTGVAHKRSDRMDEIVHAFELHKYFPELDGHVDIDVHQKIQSQLDAFRDSTQLSLPSISQKINNYFSDSTISSEPEKELTDSLNDGMFHELVKEVDDLNQACSVADIEFVSGITNEAHKLICSFESGDVERTEEAGIKLAAGLIFVADSLNGQIDVDQIWMQNGASKLRALSAINNAQQGDTETYQEHVGGSERQALMAVVGAEVQQNLNDIEEHLANFSGDVDNVGLLTGVDQKLHQIRGALQVLGEPKMSLLLQMTEKQFAGLHRGELEVSDKLNEALAVSVGTMQEYVSGLQTQRQGMDDLLDRSITTLELAIGKTVSRADVETLLGNCSGSLFSWLADQSDFTLFTEIKANLRDLSVLAKQTKLFDAAALVKEQSRLVDVISQTPSFLNDNVISSLQNNMVQITEQVLQLYGTQDTVEELGVSDTSLRQEHKSGLTDDGLKYYDDMSLEGLAVEGDDVGRENANVTAIAKRHAQQSKLFTPSDDVIFEAFIEESADLLNEAERLHVQCKKDLDDKVATRELRRAFHTLKGSARMIGLEQVGELAWYNESIFNYVLDTGKGLNHQILNLSGDAIVQLKHHQGERYANTYEIDVEAWGTRTEQLLLNGTSDEQSDSGVSDVSAQAPSEGIAEDDEISFSAIDDERMREVYAHENLTHIEVIKQQLSLPSVSLESDGVLAIALHTMSGNAKTLGLKAVSKAYSTAETLCMEKQNVDQALDIDDRNMINHLLHLSSDCIANVGEQAPYFLIDEPAWKAVSDELQKQVDHVSVKGGSDFQIDLGDAAYLQVSDDAGNGDSASELENARVAAVFDSLDTIDDLIDEQQIKEHDFSDSTQGNDELAELENSLSMLRQQRTGNNDGSSVLDSQQNLVAKPGDSNSSGKAEVSGRSELEKTDNRVSLLPDDLTNLIEEDLLGMAQEMESAALSAENNTSEHSEDPVKPNAELLDLLELSDVDVKADTISATDISLGDGELESRDVAKPDMNVDSDFREEKDKIKTEAEVVTETEIESESGAEFNQTPDISSGEGVVGFINPASDVNDEVSDELRLIFLQELTLIRVELDDEVANLQSQETADPVIEGVMRHLHTIKGSSMVAEATALAELTHKVESYLESNLIESDGELRKIKAVLENYVDELEAAANSYKENVLFKPDQSLLLSLEDVDDSIVDVESKSDDEEIKTTTSVDFIKPKEVIKLEESIKPIELFNIDKGDENSAIDSAEVSSSLDVLGDDLSDDGLNVIAKSTKGSTVNKGKNKDTQDRQDNSTALRIRTETLDSLTNFVGDANMNRSQMREDVLSIKTVVDDLYENVLSFGKQLRELEIEADSKIRSRSHDDIAADRGEEFDPLELDRYTKLQQLSRGLAENFDELGNIQSTLGSFIYKAETTLQKQGRLNRELQDEIMEVRLVSFGGIASQLRQVVRRTAKNLGKQVKLEIQGSDVRLDKTVLDGLVPILDHMLRNAVDHGIELPEVRIANAKPAIGNIVVSCTQVAHEIVVVVKDDGAGLDFDKIHRQAIARKLLTEGQVINPDDVLLYISKSGFSTAPELTHISGRGVGMDVVQSGLRRLSGRIKYDAEQSDVGSAFVLQLPISLTVTSVMFVESGQEQFAITARTIERIVNVDAQQIHAYLQEDKPLIEVDGHEYALIDLAKYLGYESQLSQLQGNLAVVLSNSGTQNIAVVVEELHDTQEVVVKSLGEHLGQIPIYAGATIRSSGKVVLLIDLVGISYYESRVALPELSDGPNQAVCNVMVVDDSLTVRKSAERDILALGVNVVLAKDGQDAQEQLRHSVPDMILLDIEMPRMDGFELLKWIRQQDSVKHIPVAIISSRATEKHIDKATALGCNAFLGKPYLLDDLVNVFNKHLPLDKPLVQS